MIRFDPIGGGPDRARRPLAPSGRSLYWTSLNAGKRSLAVDLRSAEGRDLVRALVAAPGPDGGVLLTNFSPSWLSYKSVTAARPDAITLSIEGNPDGSTATDYTVQCATGYPYVTGSGGPDAPVNGALPAWDVACALHGAMSVVAALRRRDRTGNGAEIRLALSDVAFATMSHLGVLAEAEMLGVERRSSANDVPGAFGRDFAAADGRRVMVVAISPRQWSSLIQACGMEEAVAALEKALGLDFRDEGARFEARDVLAGLVGRWCAARTFVEVAEAFNRHGVAWGPYQSVRELLHDDPRCSTANPIFGRVRTEGVGEHLAAGLPARVRGMAPGPSGPAPVPGQHTDEVLATVLGLTGAQIGVLHDRGIVAGPALGHT